MNDIATDRLLKLRTVAEMLDASVSTVKSWVYKGADGVKLRTVKLPTGGVRVQSSALHEFLNRFNATVEVKRKESGLKRHNL